MLPRRGASTPLCLPARYTDGFVGRPQRPRSRCAVDAGTWPRSASAVRHHRSRWLTRLDPLHRTRPAPEVSGNLQDTLIALCQGPPDACLGAGINLGPTEGLAIGD